MSSVPSMQPVSVPAPPVMAVPPSTTPAMMFISMPSMLVGCICVIMQVRIRPARLAIMPTNTYIKNLVLRTPKPARWALTSLPPMA